MHGDPNGARCGPSLLTEIRLRHGIWRVIAEGLPAFSRTPPLKCQPRRAHECLLLAAGGRHPDGKQGGGESGAARNVRRAGRRTGRSLPGGMRRGAFTFELCEADDGRGDSLRPPFCPESGVVSVGLRVGELPVCAGKECCCWAVRGHAHTVTRPPCAKPAAALRCSG